MNESAMDWPLSREEKKTQILRLYNEDVQAADTMLSSGEKALEALREELDAVRQAAGVHKAVRSTLLEASEAVKAADAAEPASDGCEAEAEIERLRAAVESAAAVLRAIVPEKDDPLALQRSRPRSRSEGSTRGAAALRPALCRGPREKSRDGGKRRVSFGKQPEEEPVEANHHVFEDEDVEVPGMDWKLEKPILRGHAAKQECKPLQAQGQGGSTSFKVHALWFVCCIALAAGLGFWAFNMGTKSAPPPKVVHRTIGDPACWVEGFRPEFCCVGKGGNPKCWDAKHNYARCCLPKDEF
eukprot:TRINITY_DN6756_c0_g1_i2.p1 TRINITY_DN6756_c0_g1~~TRINITY_DN6756_c0_g1_i2.p1  ORF type:complete len:299 (+),score=75.55 TRINITY_DN6756_c0_g1_i2:53-949(+)